MAEAVERLRLPLLVVDPVMVAKGGDRLLDADAERAYASGCSPLATVRHAQPAGGGGAARPARAHARRACARPRARCTRWARARWWSRAATCEGDAVDVFFDGERLEELPAPRIDTANTHGTGCTYSAAIAARLALGRAAARGGARGQGLPHGGDPPLVFASAAATGPWTTCTRSPAASVRR